jgi:two-component sensor histidine kinase
MSQTVTNTAIGVLIAEAQANAAKHAAKDRSTIKGVVVSEAQANAILNTTTANE